MWYRSSNKNRGFIHQIANKESHTQFYTAMCKESAKGQRPSTSTTGNDHHEARSHQHQNSEDGDAVLPNPSARYWMPKFCASGENLTEWLIKNREDRALHVSLYPLAIVVQHQRKCSIRTFNITCLTVTLPLNVSLDLGSRVGRYTT